MLGADSKNMLLLTWGKGTRKAEKNVRAEECPRGETSAVNKPMGECPASDSRDSGSWTIISYCQS